MRTQISKPVLVYDGDCQFCLYCIFRWSHITKDRIDYAPYQEVYSNFPEIPVSEFQSSVKLILENGQVYSGAAAILSALDHSTFLWCYNKLPGFCYISEAIYQFVAKRRRRFSQITRWLWKKYSD